MQLKDIDYIDSLTKEFLSLPENTSDKDWIIRILPEKFKDIAKYVEFTVFKNFFQHTEQHYTDNYEIYDESSHFVAVFDGKKGVVAGMLRIIIPVGGELKCFKAFRQAGESGGWGISIEDMYRSIGGDYMKDVESSWEISSIAVLSEYSSGGAINGASLGLYHSCFKLAIEKKIKYLFAIQEQKPFENVQQFGQPFSRIPNLEDKAYEAETLSVPTYMEIAETVKKLTAWNADIAALLIEGKGLELGYDIKV